MILDSTTFVDGAFLQFDQFINNDARFISSNIVHASMNDHDVLFFSK